jgi:hypothetical protein
MKVGVFEKDGNIEKRLAAAQANGGKKYKMWL